MEHIKNVGLSLCNVQVLVEQHIDVFHHFILNDYLRFKKLTPLLSSNHILFISFTMQRDMQWEMATFYTDFLNLSYISNVRLKVIPSSWEENSRFEVYRTKSLQVTCFNLYVLRLESSWLAIWIWFWRLCVCVDTFGSVPYGCRHWGFNPIFYRSHH